MRPLLAHTCSLVICALGLASGCTRSYSGFGIKSVTPELLAKYEPPSLPAEVIQKVESMLAAEAPSLGRISPDGKTVYFNWNVGGISQVFRLDGPGRPPVKMTDGDEATWVAGITPDGTTLLVIRDKNGEEEPGLYLLSASGGSLQLISDEPGVETRVAFITDDSRFIYYTANVKTRGSGSIHRYDRSQNKSERLFRESGQWSVDDHLPDGRLLLRRGGGENARYFEYDISSGRKTALLGDDERTEYKAAFGASPGELLVLTNRFGDNRRLYSWKQGRFAPVTPDLKIDVTHFYIDLPRTRIFYTMNDGGYSRPKIIDAKTHAEIPLPALPQADQVFIGSTSRDGRYTFLGVQTAKSPSVWYAHDWKTGELTQWFVPPAKVDTSGYAAASLEYYPAKDGNKIPMFVRRPQTCQQPCPVIVSFHGGPAAQSLPGFNPRAQVFVDAGFVYVEPNVRGSEGYGKAWVHADDGPKRLDVIGDIADCARYLRTAWAFQGKAPKLGVMGASYGGYSTLMAMSLFAGEYDVGVANVGMSNLETFLQAISFRGRHEEYGSLRDHALLYKLSPMNYVDRIRGPLLILHGANDPRVPVGESIQMHDAIERRGIPTQLIIFRDEGHGSRKRRNRVTEIGATLQFFEKYLKTQS